MVFSGGYPNRLLGRLHLTEDGYPRTLLAAAAIVVVAWVPTGLLGLPQHVSIGPNFKTAFLLDLGAYFQYFVVLPILFAWEPLIDREIVRTVGYFKDADLIPADARDRFSSALIRLDQLRRARWIELSCILLAYVMTALWFRDELSDGVSSWPAIANGGHEQLTFAGWWMAIIGEPLYLYSLLWFISRVGIWIFTVWHISRLPLVLPAGHADRVAGLGPLVRVQTRFVVPLFGVGVWLAAMTGYELLADDSVLWFSVWGPVLAYILIGPLVIFVPIWFFSSRIYETRANAIVTLERTLADFVRNIGSRYTSGVGNADNPSRSQGDLAVLSILEGQLSHAKGIRVLGMDFRAMAQVCAGAILSSALPSIWHTISPYVLRHH